jgi:hypothetical protein
MGGTEPAIFELNFAVDLDPKIVATLTNDDLKDAGVWMYYLPRQVDADALALSKVERDHSIRMTLVRSKSVLGCRALTFKGDFRRLQTYYKNLEFDVSEFLRTAQLLANKKRNGGNGQRAKTDDGRGPGPMIA